MVEDTLRERMERCLQADQRIAELEEALKKIRDLEVISLSSNAVTWHRHSIEMKNIARKVLNREVKDD